MKQRLDVRERPSPRPRPRPQPEEAEPAEDGPGEAVTGAPEAETSDVTTEPVAKSEPDAEAESAEPAEGEQDTPGEPTEKPRRNWRFRAVVAALAVLTVLAVAAGIFSYMQVRSDSEADRLRAEAVQAASQQAVNLLTVNSGNVDAQLAALTGNATGDFQRQFEGIAKTFGDVVRQGQVDSTGRVESAGVDQISGDTARVQLALSSDVRNAQSKDPQTRQYRITVDLERKEDRWLVAGMQFVP